MLAREAHCLLCGAEEVLVYFGLTWNGVAWLRIMKQLLENDAYSLLYHNFFHITFPHSLHGAADWDGRLKILVASVVKLRRFPEFPSHCVHKAICKLSVLEIQQRLMFTSGIDNLLYFSFWKLVHVPLYLPEIVSLSCFHLTFLPPCLSLFLTPFLFP